MRWDDYLILVALVRSSHQASTTASNTSTSNQTIAFFGSITNVYQVANGLGRHIDSLTPRERSGFLEWTLIAETQIIIGTCFTKVSVCAFILRIMRRTNKMLTHFVHALMTLVVVTTLGLVITFLLQCRPLNALYDPEVAGTCYSQHVTFSVAYAQGGELAQIIICAKLAHNIIAVSILTDFLCAGLPFLIMRKLQMKKKRKIGLSLLMGLGVL